MRNFLLGMVVGALGMIAVVALGWINVASPRTKEASAASTTVAINTPQVRQDAKSLVSGKSPTAIDDRFISGRIMQLDRGKRQLLIQSVDQKLLSLDIMADTHIRIHDRDGTFGDLDVSQPVTATYFVLEGKNKCRSITVEQ